MYSEIDFIFIGISNVTLTNGDGVTVTLYAGGLLSNAGNATFVTGLCNVYSIVIANLVNVDIIISD